MIEYKLIGKNNSPMNLDNVEEVNKSIMEVFPGTDIDTNRMGERIRKTYGMNGNAFHIYYRNSEAKIFIPKEYDDLIKNKLEFTGLKCQ